MSFLIPVSESEVNFGDEISSMTTRVSLKSRGSVVPGIHIGEADVKSGDVARWILRSFLD